MGDEDRNEFIRRGEYNAHRDFDAQRYATLILKLEALHERMTGDRNTQNEVNRHMETRMQALGEKVDAQGAAITAQIAAQSQAITAQIAAGQSLQETKLDTIRGQGATTNRTLAALTLTVLLIAYVVAPGLYQFLATGKVLH